MTVFMSEADYNFKVYVLRLLFPPPLSDAHALRRSTHMPATEGTQDTLPAAGQPGTRGPPVPLRVLASAGCARAGLFYPVQWKPI